MGLFGHGEREQAAALQFPDRLPPQRLVGAHQDGEQAEQRDVQAIRVRRAEIGQGLGEAGQTQKVEPVPPARKRLGGQEAGVKTVSGLEFDPVRVPDFLPVFLFQRVVPFRAEELDQQANGRVLQILRRAGRRRRRFERQWIQGFVGNRTSCDSKRRQTTPLGMRGAGIEGAACGGTGLLLRASRSASPSLVIPARIRVKRPGCTRSISSHSRCEQSAAAPPSLPRRGMR